MTPHSFRGGNRRLLSLAAIAGAGLLTGCASSTKSTSQREFSSPTQAANELFAAIRAKDNRALMSIFGPDAGEMLASGDPVDDQNQREVLLVAAEQKWSLQDKSPTEQELIIGDENWPFPVPLVKDASGWRFDTATGKREVLARRIGRNELTVIGLFHTYVKAQNEYAAAGRDGQPAGAYAQRIRSEDGKHNGLYWPVTPGETPSPLGELVSKATIDGYTGSHLAAFHGYTFKLLTSQGPLAPGGAMDYIQNGRMSGGFGLLAYPAEYGNSGVMSFMIDRSGILLEADLGEETSKTAPAISSFNPDPRWQPVK